MACARFSNTHRQLGGAEPVVAGDRRGKCVQGGWGRRLQPEESLRVVLSVPWLVYAISLLSIAAVPGDGE